MHPTATPDAMKAEELCKKKGIWAGPERLMSTIEQFDSTTYAIRVGTRAGRIEWTSWELLTDECFRSPTSQQLTHRKAHYAAGDRRCAYLSKFPLSGPSLPALFPPSFPTQSRSLWLRFCCQSTLNNMLMSVRSPAMFRSLTLHICRSAGRHWGKRRRAFPSL